MNRRRSARPTNRWRLFNLELGIREPESVLRTRVASMIGVEVEQLRGFRIAHKSVDARRRSGSRRLRFVVHVDVTLDESQGGERFRSAVRSGRVVEAPPVGSLRVDDVRPSARGVRVVVVGSGPAGLFAARVLAENGARVDLIDRGASLARRGRDLVRFHRTRVPNPESNLLFGEGGAGTYSDGKLYTRIDDPLEVPCLEELVQCGAQSEILYDSRAHIGTDRLHRLLPVLRERLESLGVRFHWNTRMDSLVSADGGSVTAVRSSKGEIPCEALFLAPGHSAEDTVRELHRLGVRVDAKPFQLGVRIEHPQGLIDRGRYGCGPDAELLGPAYYNLVCSPRGLPSTYSFCMCPGGRIVASVNTPGVLCTNGMSNSLHSSPWANAALVTTFGPDEFGPGPFAGIEFQRRLERRFFEAGGCDYTAPAQRADDFLAGRLTRHPPRSSYTFGTCPGRIDELLPGRAREAIARALRRFDRQIPGFGGPEGLLVGLESRSSGPIRLTRDRDRLTALGWSNLYPIGEGAGYAGGIMSAAIDGARAARRFLSGDPATDC